MVAQSSKTASEKVQARLLFAWRCLHADPERARAEVDSACQQAETIGRDARPFGELVRGFIELRFGEAMHAEAHLNAAINGFGARQHQPFARLAEDALLIAGFKRGEKNDCVRRLDASLSAPAGTRLPDHLGYVHHWLAVLDRKQRRFEASIDHFHMALYFARQSSDAGFEAMVLASLGGMQLDLNNRPDALRTLEEGYRIAQGLATKTWLGPNALNLALVYIETGDPARAKEILDRHEKDAAVWSIVPKLYRNFARGMLACSLGDWRQARLSADAMLAVLPANSDDAHFAHGRIQAEILLAKGEPSAVLALYRELLAMFPAAEGSVDLTHLVDIASRAAARHGDFRAAYDLSLEVSARRTRLIERSIRARLETRRAEAALREMERERTSALREAARSDKERRRLASLNVRLRAQMSEIRSLQRELKEQAATDPLTGLRNRRLLGESVDAALALSARGGGPVVLVCFDLDHFKRVNDWHGHAAGDEVLKRFAHELRARKRRADLAFRIGGEEFCVLLRGCDAGQAKVWAANVLQAWREVTIPVGAGSLYRLTFSAGIACNGDAGQTADGLLRAADKAMYRAKHAGRNRVAVGR